MSETIIKLFLPAEKKGRLLIKVSILKSRKQTGERCGGVFPAPVCSPCQRCSSSPAQLNTEPRQQQIEDKLSAEIKGWEREGGRTEGGWLYGSEAHVSDLWSACLHQRPGPNESQTHARARTHTLLTELSPSIHGGTDNSVSIQLV